MKDAHHAMNAMLIRFALARLWQAMRSILVEFHALNHPICTTDMVSISAKAEQVASSQPKAAASTLPHCIAKQAQQLAALSKPDAAAECAICLEQISEQCSQQLLACGHSFHRVCATRWLKGDGHGRCPMCRQPAGRSRRHMRPGVPVQDGVGWSSREGTEAEGRLVLAASEGDCEAVARLLADGVDVNALASHAPMDNNTPLTAAVAAGHAAVVRLLLEHEDIDVNMDNEAGRTPLLCAAARANVGILLWLLSARGLDVNGNPEGTMTALALAACNGEATIVRALLGVHGLEMDAVDDGKTALDYAQKAGHDQIADTLRAAGARHAHEI